MVWILTPRRRAWETEVCQRAHHMRMGRDQRHRARAECRIKAVWNGACCEVAEIAPSSACS
jgi:hypothetical protein